MTDRRITASELVEAMASIWQGVGQKSRAAYTLRACIEQQQAEIARLREALEDALGRRQVTHIHAALRRALEADDE